MIHSFPDKRMQSIFGAMAPVGVSAVAYDGKEIARQASTCWAATRTGMQKYGSFRRLRRR